MRGTVHCINKKHITTGGYVLLPSHGVLGTSSVSRCAAKRTKESRPAALFFLQKCNYGIRLTSLCTAWFSSKPQGT